MFLCSGSPLNILLTWCHQADQLLDSNHRSKCPSEQTHGTKELLFSEHFFWNLSFILLHNLRVMSWALSPLPIVKSALKFGCGCHVQCCVDRWNLRWFKSDFMPCSCFPSVNTWAITLEWLCLKSSSLLLCCCTVACGPDMGAILQAFCMA